MAGLTLEAETSPHAIFPCESRTPLVVMVMLLVDGWVVYLLMDARSRNR